MLTSRVFSAAAAFSGAVGGVFALLTACATQPPAAQLAAACNGLATAYLTAAGYKAQGKLSVDQIATLVQLEPVALAACDKAHPPTDPALALNTALDAAQRVALVNAGVK